MKSPPAKGIAEAGVLRGVNWGRPSPAIFRGMWPGPSWTPGLRPAECPEKQNKCVLVKPLRLWDSVNAAGRDSYGRHHMPGTCVPNLEDRMGNPLSFPRDKVVRRVRIHLRARRLSSQLGICISSCTFPALQPEASCTTSWGLVTPLV